MPWTTATSLTEETNETLNVLQNPEQAYDGDWSSYASKYLRGKITRMWVRLTLHKSLPWCSKIRIRAQKEAAPSTGVDVVYRVHIYHDVPYPLVGEWEWSTLYTYHTRTSWSDDRILTFPMGIVSGAEIYFLNTDTYWGTRMRLYEVQFYWEAPPDALPPRTQFFLA